MAVWGEPMKASWSRILGIFSAALTGCGSSGYSGDPIDIALEACIDFVSKTRSSTEIASGLSDQGWEIQSRNSRLPIHEDNVEYDARFGEYQIIYFQHFRSRNGAANTPANPPTYMCYIGAVAENEAQALVLSGKIKARTGITNSVIIDNPEFGSATIRQNRFSQGTRVQLHVNFASPLVP